MGIQALRLLTNNPKKVRAIEQYGLRVSERIALEVAPTEENGAYLKTKQDKLGHILAIK